MEVEKLQNVAQLRNKIKEIDIHTWSKGGTDSDNAEDFFPDKIKSKSLDWNGGYRLV